MRKSEKRKQKRKLGSSLSTTTKTIENFNLFVKLSNLPLDSNTNQEGELTLYADSSEDKIPLMKAIAMHPPQPEPV